VPSVCFYFQVHQPFRLKNYSYFHIGKDHAYFDESQNREIMKKVATKCYLPANKLMLELIQRHEGAFKISYSITGVAIEQMMRYSPETLESFVELSKTGCVEFLAETYHHSLASLYNIDEFKQQVTAHTHLIQKLFNQTPSVFRNTELIFNDDIAHTIQTMGYRGAITEGADDILSWRSPHFVYSKPSGGLKLLLKSYRLSDDIAFRFSNQGWREFPLTAPKFAGWLHSISGNGETVNLFMDYETFGEHQWESTGIFEFMRILPTEIRRHSDWNFLTPSGVLDRYQPVAELSYPRLVSWADIERDITAWRGNSMQKRALEQVFELAREVSRSNNSDILELWRKLQTSDHFYYMCTKWFADGDVHAYFNPYKSPYEAFINYMNVLMDFKKSILGHKSEHINRTDA
jgi:alpha-amylase